MAWYDVFNYENESDKYIRLEQEQRKRMQQKEFQRTGGRSMLPESFQSQMSTYDSDYDSVKSQYEYNKSVFFEGLRMPNFSKTEKIKSQKPPSVFGSLLMQVNAKPLVKPLKVYKYKTIDEDTGASVITRQKEIEVWGENAHNYFYMTKDGIQSINKNEVSLSEMDQKTLEIRYMQQVNDQAQKMAKTGNTKQIQEMEKKDQGFLGKAKEALSAFGGEFLEAADSLVSNLQVIDYDAYDPTYEYTKKIKDPKKRQEKLDLFFPKGFSKAQDAKNAGKSKAEIDKARALDKEEAKISFRRDFPIESIAEYYRKEDNNSLNTTEKVAGTLGVLAESVAEIVLLKKVSGSAINKLTELGKIKEGTKLGKVVKHTVDSLITGGGFGFLQEFKKGDAKAMDYVRAVTENTLFFFAGGGASAAVGKAIGPTRTALGAFGKGVATGTAFGTVGTASTLPMMSEEERTAENLGKTAGIGFAIDVGTSAIPMLKGARKGIKQAVTKGIGKKVAISEATKKIPKVSKEFNLNRPLKEIPKKDRAKVAHETKKKMLDKIGANIKNKVGSAEPKKIMEYYKNKYKTLLKGDVTIDKTLTGESKFARIEPQYENGKLVKMEVRINPNKSENEIAAALRHEIEHMIDKRLGYNVADTRIKNPKTLGEYMMQPGHLSKYKNFEMEYLENIYKNEFKGKLAAAKVDMSRKDQLLKDYKTASPAKRKQILTQLGQIKSRERIGLETVPQGSSLANENIHSRNKIITEASNLPVYIPPKKPLGTKIKNWWEDFYTNWINRQHGIDKLGKQTKMTSQNYTKHYGTVDYINTRNLVSRTGDAIGNKSLKDVLVAPKGYQAEYESYLLHKHHVSRMAAGKPVLFKGEEAISIDEAKKIVSNYEKTFPEFKKHAEEYKQFMDDFMREYAVDGGLLTAREYKSMKFLYPDYVPTYRSVEEMGIDPKVQAISAKPFKKATGGQEQIIPLIEALPNQIQKIVRAERRNKIGVEILNNIIKDKEAMKPYAQIYNVKKGSKSVLDKRIASFAEKGKDDIATLANRFDELLITDAPTKGRFMVVMDNGKPITLRINDDSLWKALANVQNSNTSNMPNMLRIFNKYITNNVKGTLTVYNPFFAVRNVVRDIPTAYVQGSVNDPIKFTKNLFGSAKSIMTKDDLYKKFQALGVGQTNITKIEKVENSLIKQGWKKPFYWIAKALNLAGDFTETLPRLAEFKHTYQTLKAAGSLEELAVREAMYNAGEVTVNFARGGENTKMLEPIFMYMNAGVQGFDRWSRSLFVEAVKNKNFKPMLKAFGVTLAPSIVLPLINRAWNPNWDEAEYKDLPNYLTDHYYVIPVGDESYLKLPKTRENGFLFSTVFERLHRHFIEKDPDAFDGMGEALAKSTLNPFAEFSRAGILGPVINLKWGGNKDYFGRPIEPLSQQLDKRSKRYISKDTTSKASKALGSVLEKVGLSPAQTDYVVKSYAGIIADMYLAINDTDDTLTEKIKRGSHTFHDASTGGKAQSKMYEEKDKASTAVADFEIANGIKDLRQKLKDSGITSTTRINRKIREQLGTRKWNEYQKLKEKKKELNSDE